MPMKAIERSLAIDWSVSPNLIVLASIALFFVLWWRFTYWQRRGLPVPPFSFYWNHMKAGFLLENSFADRDISLYQTVKKMGLKHAGTYFLVSPFYIPVDLGIIKLILQNDFDHFVDRGMYMDESDPLSSNLVNMPGRKWRVLRAKLSPIFTSGKMKKMFENLLECTGGLHKAMDDHLKEAVDIKDILGRFITDAIVSCAFGVKNNSLQDPDNEFWTYGRALFIEKTFMENVKFGLFFSIPEVLRKLNIKSFPKDVSDFFCKVVKEMVTYREENEIFREDFLHPLLQLKKKGKIIEDEKLSAENLTPGENSMTMEEIIAQAFIFFEAGLETTASTISFCLYELSCNKSIQNKVRREINEMLKKHKGKMTYESVGELVYLDQVISETLRMYPPLPSLPRICTKDYKIPGTDVVLEKGVRIVISTVGIHRDPEHYPDPDKFDPERFSEENKKKRKDFTYMPFGLGPRICIGKRFGLMQIKVGLTSLLRRYEFNVSNKTQEPLKFNPRILSIAIKGDIWLEFNKVSESKFEAEDNALCTEASN